MKLLTGATGQAGSFIVNEFAQRNALAFGGALPGAA